MGKVKETLYSKVQTVSGINGDAWRLEPPSEKQINLLRKHGFEVPTTKGDASDIIGGKKPGLKKISVEPFTFGSGSISCDQHGLMNFCDDGNGNVWDFDAFDEN